MPKQVYYEGQKFANPNDKNAPVLVYRGGKFLPDTPAAAMPAAYAQAFATQKAASDIKKIDAAGEGVQTADSLTATSGQARQLLDEGVPTGTFAGTRMNIGRAIGNDVTSTLTGGFIPNRKTVAKMERFEQLTNEAVLGDVSKLKGPLSDRDIMFLKDTQAGIGKTPEGNKRALAAREWAATRLKAYESAMQSWTQKLGSPSAVNARGQSFNAFFSGWASQNIPPPTGETYTYQSKSQTVPKATPAATNALTGKSGGGNAMTGKGKKLPPIEDFFRD